MIDYCGDEVSKDGLHKMPAEEDTTRQAPVPANVTQLRSFLGLVNCCARFLANLSTTLHPLNVLLQKGTALEMGCRLPPSLQPSEATDRLGFGAHPF